jgi:hypothetical protein
VFAEEKWTTVITKWSMYFLYVYEIGKLLKLFYEVGRGDEGEWWRGESS